MSKTNIEAFTLPDGSILAVDGTREEMAQKLARVYRVVGDLALIGDIQAAIMRRWSLSGLKWIKTRAWKIASS